MREVGIIVAMQKEWDALFVQKGGAGKDFFQFETKNGTLVTALLSGIGKVNAAVAAYRLWKQYGCTDILSFGCAGGSNYSVKVGDVIVGDEYIYWDVNCGAPNEVGQIQGCPETFASNYTSWKFLQNEKHGLISTGDTFIESELLMEAVLRTMYPEHCPLVLDMESAAIAQVCHQRNIGFTSVRVVSDNPLSGESASQYENFWIKRDETLGKLLEKFCEED